VDQIEQARAIMNACLSIEIVRINLKAFLDQVNQELSNPAMYSNYGITDSWQNNCQIISINKQYIYINRNNI
jgi:hypothetical protein